MQKKFAATIGLDWADSHHDLWLQSADGGKPEHVILEQEPETLHSWLAQIRARFKNQPVAIAMLSGSAQAPLPGHRPDPPTGQLGGEAARPGRSAHPISGGGEPAPGENGFLMASMTNSVSFYVFLAFSTRLFIDTIIYC